MLRKPPKCWKLYDFKQRIVSVNGSLVWTMSSNRNRRHSQLRRVVRTPNRAKCSRWWLLAQRSVSADHVSFVYVILLQEGNFGMYLQYLAHHGCVHYTNTTIPGGCLSMSIVVYEIVVYKTSSKFSAMTIDRCHEQDNGSVKVANGAVGLTEKPAALMRWKVAGPGVAR